MKKITSRCTVCCRYEGRGFKVPPQPDLPEFRLSQKPVFTYVGVDYAGPLYIKEPNCSITKKVYVVLLTCCSTRAVHLKLATDLSGDVFICCLWRFTARRGLPEIIVSDNVRQRSYERCFHIQVSRDSLQIEELRGSFTWTEHPGGVGFSKG